MSEALYIDRAGPIGKDNVDFRKLSGYLADNVSHINEPIEISQFPSGFSNLTYLIKSGVQEYVLRRPPVGANIKTAHDMGREFRVLSLLKPIYPNVPQPVLYCEDPDIIGSPFYVMERVKGVILRKSVPDGMQLSPNLMKAISKGTVDHLAQLHRLPLDSGLGDLGRPEGYVTRQVEGWIKRYFKAETDEVPDMNDTADWLQSNIPTTNEAAFIHNDFKYDNLVLNPNDLTEIIAVLDWEMATVGDPLMDLGTSLGYWAEACDPQEIRSNLTWLPGNLTREEVAQRYCAQTGRSMDNILFYYVYGLFKIGGIVQQIYARYKQGVAKDPRFALLFYILKTCATNAQKAISLNRISNLY